MKRAMTGLEGLEFVSGGFSAGCEECRAAHDICCEHKAAALWQNGEIDEELAFSWTSCDACNSTLGGSRYAVHGRDGDDLVHLDVCLDCIEAIND